MCRLSYITSNKIDRAFLTELFKNLEKSAGGDGNGIGGFIGGSPFISKSIVIPVEEFANTQINHEWDNGFLFHTRRASVGVVDNNNCHPFMWGNTITIHNGQVEGIGVLKLMMLENLDKYEVDGWTIDKIASTSDSDILSYFIWKKGFGIASMLDCGTILTLYPNEIRMYVGYCLEAIQYGSDWIYASEFSDKMGLAAEQWLVFGKGTDITITGNNCVLNTGYYVDGKELLEAKKKKKKGKHCDIMVV